MSRNFKGHKRPIDMDKWNALVDTEITCGSSPDTMDIGECKESIMGTMSPTAIGDITILPPYVAPEHRRILEDAQLALEEHQERLMQNIKRTLFERSPNTSPGDQEIYAAEMAFKNDKGRIALTKNLGSLRLLYERPRFLVRNVQPTEEV